MNKGCPTFSGSSKRWENKFSLTPFPSFLAQVLQHLQQAFILWILRARVMKIYEDPFTVPEGKLWHYVRFFGLLFWNTIYLSPIAIDLDPIISAFARHLPHFVAIGDILGVDDRIEVEPDHFFLVLRCRILILLQLPHQFGIERALSVFQNQVRAGK